MKKRILAALILLLALLAGCAADEPVPTPAPSEAVVSSGECFKITQERSNGVTKYVYTVTDRDGKELESAMCARQPRVAVINDDLIGIRFYTDDRSFCRYYDVTKGLVSESFFNAFWDNGTLVAYNDYAGGHRMVVCDIFDSEGYSFEKEIDCPALTITVTECALDESTGELTVKYVYGDNSASSGIVKLRTK